MRPLVSELWSIAAAPRLDRAGIDALRDRKLRRTVRHAYECVPFYRELFDSAGVRPEDVRSAADLTRLPTTSRGALQEAGVAGRLAAGFRREDCRVLHTSGSTGQPLEVRMSPWDWRIRKLVELRTMRRLGLRMSDRLVTVGPSKSIPPSLHQRLGFYRTEIVTGLLSVEEQLEKLRELRPDVLWIYPTVLASIYETGARLSDYASPRQVFYSSEALDDLSLRRLDEDLGAEVCNFYGCLEVGRVAAQCPDGGGLHVSEDHVVLEIEPLDGDLLADGGAGTVLLTTLNARAMPLLRYRVGDMASWSAAPCGCGSPFLSIAPPLGRLTDCARLPSGRKVTAHRFYFFLREVEGVLRFQVVQEAIDFLRVLIVCERPPDAAALARLREGLASAAIEPMRIQIELVDRIPRQGLKFRSFVSKLPAES